MSALSQREKMLGNEPIGSLLAKMAIPATVAMLINALYSIVDRMFIKEAVGDLGTAGLTLSFPVQMMVMAFALLLGVGGASAVSRLMGERKNNDASVVAGNVFKISAILGLIMGVVGFFNSEFISTLLAGLEGPLEDAHVFVADMGMTKGEIAAQTLGYTQQYLSIIFIGSFFMSMAMAMNNIVRAEGDSMFSMVIMIAGAVLNIILDSIFIMGLGMGVAGAAWATVIGQIVSFLLVVYFFTSKRSILRLNWSHFKINFKYLKETVIMGSGSFVRQIGGTVILLLVNQQLTKYGGDLSYLSIYGAISALVMVVLLPIFGIVQGFQPIAGYNYGAKNMGRVKESLLVTSIIATLICMIAFVVIWIGAEPMLSGFVEAEGLLETAGEALRIVIFVLPVLGLQLVGSTFFQAIGKAVPSLFLSLSRQFIFLLPLIYILPPMFDVQGIWISFPIADTIATLVTVIWTLVELRRLHVFDKDTKVLKEAASIAIASEDID